MSWTNLAHKQPLIGFSLYQKNQNKKEEKIVKKRMRTYLK